jgi:hypothetical protein
VQSHHGGKVIIADPWRPTPLRQIANIVLPLRKTGDVRFYSKPEMQKMLEQSGFKLISWEQVESAFILVATPR